MKHATSSHAILRVEAWANLKVSLDIPHWLETVTRLARCASAAPQAVVTGQMGGSTTALMQSAPRSQSTLALYISPASNRRTKCRSTQYAGESDAHSRAGSARSPVDASEMRKVVRRVRAIGEGGIDRRANGMKHNTKGRQSGCIVLGSALYSAVTRPPAKNSLAGPNG